MDPEFTIEVIKDMNMMFHWQIKSTRNKRIVCKSEKYTRKEMCYKVPHKLAYLIDCEIAFIDMNKWDDSDAIDDSSPYIQERV